MQKFVHVCVEVEAFKINYMLGVLPKSLSTQQGRLFTYAHLSHAKGGKSPSYADGGNCCPSSWSSCSGVVLPL